MVVKDFINTYTVSGIVYVLKEGELKILLVRNNDGTIGFPGGKEAKVDAGSMIKTFEREFDEEVPSASKLTLGNKTVFYEIVKKRDDDENQKMTHYFLISRLKNAFIPFENGRREFFVSWKEVFLYENLRPTVTPGLTAFLFKLKELANENHLIRRAWNDAYDKNDDLHHFCQAFDLPDSKGNVSVKNYLAVDILGMSTVLSKPS
ncbi:MAG: hypothetical protein WCO58_00280 [bacterium]